MNLSTYSCNTEGLYFLHLLFYPEISPDFQRNFLSQLRQEGGYDIFELNADQWLIAMNFKERSRSVYMGINQSLWDKRFKIPFHNWGYEVGVML